jgi:stress-induced morphogen
MAVEKEEIEQLLYKSFDDAELKIIDLVGDKDHYSLEITSQQFNGLNLINQHRLVKNALESILGTALHALTIKTICR